MKSLRGAEVLELRTVDKDRHVYEAVTDRGVFTVKQPRRADEHISRVAWKKLSPATLKRYRRMGFSDDKYHPRKRCRAPYLQQGETGRFMPTLMIYDDKAVGFGDFILVEGRDIPRHKIADDEKGASTALCIVDEYHGLGYGTVYGILSEYIAKQLGADYAIGNTPITGGMLGIRKRSGWTVVAYDTSGYAVIKKKL